MKKTAIIIGIAIGIVFLHWVTTNAQVLGGFGPITGPAGGTGISSSTPAQVGLCLKVSDDDPFRYELGACGGGSGGSSDFNYTVATGGTYLTPTTTTVGLLTGPNASSTIARLTIVYGTSTQATTSYIAVTTQASTSNLVVSNNLTASQLTSALLLTGAGGLFAEYTGADCTNQFVRDLSALGAPTCATVVGADVDLGDLTAGDGTIVFSGAYDGQTARTITADCVSITGSAALCDGDDASGGGGTGSNWSFVTLNSIRPTSTAVGIQLVASSTFDRLFARYATTTEATSSILTVTGTLRVPGIAISGDWVVTNGGSVEFQDASGNPLVNMQSAAQDILDLSGGVEAATLDWTALSASRVFTFPDLAGTFALLENPQTFTGLKTFSGGSISSLSTSTHATTTGTHNLGSLRINSEHFTNLLGTGLVNTGGVLTPDCATITGGAGLCDGVDADSGAGTGSNWAFLSTNFQTITPTSTLTVGIQTFASSTMDRLFARYATTSEATTTYLSVGTHASTSLLTIGGGTVNYTRESTSTVRNNTQYAWNIATTTASLLSIDTRGPLATTTLSSGVVIKNFQGGTDAFTYNHGSNLTQIDNVQLGATAFDVDSGQVTWIDMPAVTQGLGLSYTGRIQGFPVFTAYATTSNSGLKSGELGSETRFGLASTTPTGDFSIEQQASSTKVMWVGDIGTTTPHFVIDGTGWVGLATTSPWRTLSVAGSMAVTSLTAGGAGDDDICMNPTTFEFTDANAGDCVVSSIRFKENIMPQSSALSLIEKFNPVTFTYKPELDHSLVKGKLRHGLIAEEVEKFAPELVGYEDDGVTPRTVHYEEIISILIQGMKDQQKQIDSLEARVKALEKK